MQVSQSPYPVNPPQDHHHSVDHPYRAVDPFAASIHLGIRNNRRRSTINSIDEIGLPHASVGRLSNPVYDQTSTSGLSRRNSLRRQQPLQAQPSVQYSARPASAGTMDIPLVTDSPKSFNTLSLPGNSSPPPRSENESRLFYPGSQTSLAHTEAHTEPFPESQSHAFEFRRPTTPSAPAFFPRRARRNAMDAIGIIPEYPVEHAAGHPPLVLGFESGELVLTEEDFGTLPFMANNAIPRYPSPGAISYPSLHYRLGVPTSSLSPQAATTQHSQGLRRFSFGIPESLFRVHRQHRENTTQLNDSPAHSRDIPLKDYIMTFLCITLPSQVYLHCLLRLPYMYFSRVNQIFEAADLTLEEIKEMALKAGAEDKMIYQHRTMRNGKQSKLPAAYLRLKKNWEYFIDNLMREWKTLNIISGLLLSGILTVFQIEGADADPITRYTAFWSLTCALLSLLYGCFFIVRFSSMRKAYKAAEWAIAAQNNRTIFWNVWIMLAMPAIWLVWSIFAYIICIMSFMWRVHPNPEIALPQADPAISQALQLFISSVLGVGVLYAILIINTLRQYGARMDKAWSTRIEGFIQQSSQQRSPDLQVGSPPTHRFNLIPPTPPTRFGTLTSSSPPNPMARPYIPPRPQTPTYLPVYQHPNGSPPLVGGCPYRTPTATASASRRSSNRSAPRVPNQEPGVDHPELSPSDRYSDSLRNSHNPEASNERVQPVGLPIPPFALGEQRKMTPTDETDDSATIEHNDTKSTRYEPSSVGSLPEHPLSPLMLGSPISLADDSGGTGSQGTNGELQDGTAEKIDVEHPLAPRSGLETGCLYFLDSTPVLEAPL